MATWFTDFDDYDAAAGVPDGWETDSNTGAGDFADPWDTMEVAEIAEVGRQALRAEGKSPAKVRYLPWMDGPDHAANADMESLVLMQLEETGGVTGHHGFHWGQYGANPSHSALMVALRPNLATKTMVAGYKLCGSTAVNPTDFTSGVALPVEVDLTQPFWWRTRWTNVANNQVRLRSRIWQDGAEEPETWLIDINPAVADTNLLSGGRFAWAPMYWYRSRLYQVGISDNPDVDETPYGAPEPPVASFTAEVDELDLSVDASGSTDPDEDIASYEWDWGDGSTGSGVTAEHTYAAAGVYTVTLTVTDDQGLQDTFERDVEVSVPGGFSEGAGAGAEGFAACAAPDTDLLLWAQLLTVVYDLNTQQFYLTPQEVEAAAVVRYDEDAQQFYLSEDTSALDARAVVIENDTRVVREE